MINHEIVQITTGNRDQELHLSRKKSQAYLLRNNDIVRLDIAKLLKDSENDQLSEPSDYEVVVSKLADSINPGGIALDHDEGYLYF